MARISKRAPEHVAFARMQRKAANEYAQDIWQLVRGHRMLGEKFRREHPVGPYTLDFACLALQLDLEVDGKDHFTEAGKLRDAGRDAYMRQQGFEVLRIIGYRVSQDIRGVKDAIEAVVSRLQTATRQPRPVSSNQDEACEMD